MSNFICPKCGLAIVEGMRGHYKTECPHYPFEKPVKQSLSILNIKELLFVTSDKEEPFLPY